MEAPPTYDEAIAAKGQPGKPLQPGAQVPPFNPYYPPGPAQPLGPPRPDFVSHPVAHSESYQQPQMVAVTMVPTTTTRTVIVQKHSTVNHCLHCIITLLFWPWIFVWIFLCLVSE